MSPYAPEDRATALQSLIRLDTTLEEATSALASYPWDWTGNPLVVVTRADIAAIIERWSAGELSAEQVEGWATALEGRDDVGYEMPEEDELRDLVFELANPTLHAANSLDEVAARLLR